MNFEFWIIGELSKIGHHFSNEIFFKLSLSKNVNNIKCAPKLVIFNEKKKEKDLDYESQILALFDGSPLIQNSIISFEAKICLILYPPFENSTTRIAIMKGSLNECIHKNKQ